MKCDELKSVYIDRTGDWVRSGNDTGKFYLKEEVDSVINDLQKTNVMLADNAVKLNRELDKLKVEHHKERHEYIKMIAELKAKLEDAKASAYADSVDAGMRERRLKRALWRAIALFCARSCEYFNGIMSHCLMGQDDLYKRCEEKKNKYLNAMYKCRKKMEMYK